MIYALLQLHQNVQRSLAIGQMPHGTADQSPAKEPLTSTRNRLLVRHHALAKRMLIQHLSQPKLIREGRHFQDLPNHQQLTRSVVPLQQPFLGVPRLVLRPMLLDPDHRGVEHQLNQPDAVNRDVLQSHFKGLEVLSANIEICVTVCITF